MPLFPRSFHIHMRNKNNIKNTKYIHPDGIYIDEGNVIRTDNSYKVLKCVIIIIDVYYGIYAFIAVIIYNKSFEFYGNIKNKFV